MIFVHVQLLEIYGNVMCPAFSLPFDQFNKSFAAQRPGDGEAICFLYK